jgi:hypothetical protein
LLASLLLLVYLHLLVILLLLSPCSVSKVVIVQ